MITQLRKKLSGTLTHIFMGIAVFGLLGLFSLPMLIKQGSKTWVLKINATKIDQVQFENEVSTQRDRIASFKEQYGQFADMLFQSMGMSTDPKTLAFDLLTKKALLNDFASNIGLAVSQEFANKKINDHTFAMQYVSDVIPSFFYDQSGVIQNFLVKIYLQKWGMSSATFLDKVKESMLRQTAINLVNHASYVPSYEKTLFLGNQHGTKELEIISLDRKDFVREAKKNSQPSQEMLLRFFDEKNKTAQTYFTPEKRDITVWSFEASSYNISFDQESLLNYYNKHKNQHFIARQAEVTVRQLVYNVQPENAPSIASLQEELAENPSLFVEYVKKYSQDEASAKKGGLIDPLVYGKSHSPLYKAAFKLKEVGSISPVISMDNRFFVLQLVKKEPKVYKHFEEVKKDIAIIMKKQLFKKQFNADLKKVLKDGIIDTAELNHLVKLHKATKKTLLGITIDQKDPITKAAFTIKNKGTAHLVSLENEGTIVILDNIFPKSLPDIAAVIEQVRSDWYELQGALALQKTYKEIQELLPMHSFASIAEQLHLNLKKIVIHGAADKKNIALAEEYSIPREDISNLEKEGNIAFAMTPSGAFFARCAACITNENHASLEKEENDALDRATKQLIIEGLIASLHRDAKIETNESFTIPLEDYLV